MIALRKKEVMYYSWPDLFEEFLMPPLIKGNPDSVRKETKKVLDIMAPGGGYVAGASHDYSSAQHIINSAVCIKLFAI